jgi:hypothetical protein
VVTVRTALRTPLEPRAGAARAFGPALLSSLLLAATACSNDFRPRSVLADLRVLAIEASPLEVGPGESVTLVPRRLAPAGATITEERWFFCPFSIGASVGYACAVPECEVELTDAAGTPSGDRDVGVAVSADPSARAEECLALLTAGGASLPANVPSSLPQKVDLVFRYLARASDGESREAVELVPFYPGGAPSPRNRPPAIASVEIGGQQVVDGGTGPTLAPGAQLEVRVELDPASADTYVDDAGRTLTETPVVSFFTTAGRLDFDRANGPDARVALKYEEIGAADVEAEIWAVATDLRGGQTVAGPFRIPIGR